MRLNTIICTLGVLVATSCAAADYGSVWLSNSTPTTLTIAWTDPPPWPLAYASSTSQAEICWKEKPYFVGPCSGGSSGIDLGSSDYTITGLTPNTTYEVKVQTWTKKWAWGACCPFGYAWRYSQWRDVSKLTLTTPSTTNAILPVGEGLHDLAFNVQLASPSSWATVRIGYKRIGSGTAVNLTCQQLAGPAVNWVVPNEDRGWIDLSNPTSPMYTNLSGLDCKAGYIVKLYGFGPGATSGSELASTTMHTQGSWWLACNAQQVAIPSGNQVLGALVATEHEELLAQYAATIERAYGGSVEALIKAIDAQHPGVADAIAAEYEALDDLGIFDEAPAESTFHFLYWFMTKYQDGQVFWDWQFGDPLLESRGLRFVDFINEVAPEVAAEAADITALFGMGDADRDGTVDGVDVALVLGNWGTPGPIGDFNADGDVDGADIATLLGGWTPASTP